MNWSNLGALVPYFALGVAIVMPVLVQKLNTKDSRKTERWKTDTSHLRSASELVHQLHDEVRKGERALLTQDEIEDISASGKLTTIRRALEPRLSKDSELTKLFDWATQEYQWWHLAGLHGAEDLKYLVSTLIYGRPTERGIDDKGVEKFYNWLRAEVNRGTLQRSAYDKLDARLTAIQKALERRM